MVSYRRRLAVAALSLVAAVASVLSLRGQTGGVVAADAVTASTTRTVAVSWDGGIRHYRLFMPRHLSAGPHPLLIALHQLHGSAARFERQSGLDRGAERNGVVVVYPDGQGHSWNAGTCCQPAAGTTVDDVGFLAAVVADVSHRLSIDRSKVAVTGFSNGALMSYRLVCERADVVHVAVAVAGDLVVPQCLPSRPISLLHVHGARDAVIPLVGEHRSPIDPSGFPAAADSVETVSRVDGCDGGVGTPTRTGSVWRAHGCRDGARVELVTSNRLGHSYVWGSRAARTTGVDMSTLTWTFLQSVWGR